MKKQLIVLLSLFSITLSVSAQKEYKLSKSSGKLNLNISGAVIEGYNGNEIIFSSPKAEPVEVDERAKGLRTVSGSGFTDNTGLGIDVSEKGEEINVNPVGRNTKGILIIKVPQNIKISFKNTNVNQDELILKNLKNEIEVSASYNKIKLENNSGPMNVKTLYGSVDAIFNGEIKGPVSIISVYGYVDVSMPATTKANIELGTSYGNLYLAEGFKIAIDKKPVEKTDDAASGLNLVSSMGSSNFTSNLSQINIRGDKENLKGKINGGGADFIIKSNYKNVYLRDK
ncbi:hypothetical protein [Pedobacter sp.]|uniref:hypothetical protein n=1 Tax=Pedobacter sp. TaxID=1411316 RepID=UPI003C33794F